MSDFANLRDGGRQLGALLAQTLVGRARPLLMPLLPNGVPVAVGIREVLDLPVRSLPALRSESGVVVDPAPDVAGRCVVVIDDGVETGTAARAAASALRESGVESLLLAVPVCPREALADLQHRYDQVVAVVRPLARRSLAWHYADFDTIDDAAAARLLADLPGAAT